MRESISGGWLMGFVVFFVVLFSSFLAVAINYTRAFKVKNQIINIIEEYEGFTTTPADGRLITEDTLKQSSISELMEIGTAQAESYAALLSMAYNTEQEVDCNETQGKDQEGGYCLKKICAKVYKGANCSVRGSYYRVTTFINFELPIIGVNIKVPISGETTTLYYANKNDCNTCDGTN